MIANRLGPRPTARINGRPDWMITGNRQTLSQEKIDQVLSDLHAARRSAGGPDTAKRIASAQEQLAPYQSSKDSRNSYPAPRPRRAAVGSHSSSVSQLKAKARDLRRDFA